MANALACLAVVLIAGLAAHAAPDDREILAGADARIEKLRKADAVLRVTDGRGRPIAGAAVEIEQTRHAFLFGSNFYAFGRLGTPELEEAYRSRFAELLNYATTGFYWGSYEPAPGQPQYANTDRVAQWCAEHGITVKGHPLVWNTVPPRWLPEDLDEIHRLAIQRVADCISRFRGRIDIWDVVNEPTHVDRPSPQFRNRVTDMWLKVGVVDLVREALTTARKANPKATLLVNDYLLLPRDGRSFDEVLEQLNDERGRPLYDAIGLQSHMHGGYWGAARSWEVCERYARFGVPLHFTETTILSGPSRKAEQGWPSTPEGEERQAQQVAELYTALFSHPAVQAITWWDFSDNMAWQGAPAGLLRKDMSPKPAYLRLKELIKNAWWTRTSAKTDARGTARFRGFLGAYSVRAKDAKGREGTVEVTLSKTGRNEFRVTLKPAPKG